MDKKTEHKRILHGYKLLQESFDTATLPASIIKVEKHRLAEMEKLERKRQAILQKIQATSKKGIETDKLKKKEIALQHEIVDLLRS